MNPLTIGFFLAAGLAVASEPAGFMAGRPFRPERREKEKNLFVGDRAAFEVPSGNRATLRIAASPPR